MICVRMAAAEAAILRSAATGTHGTPPAERRNATTEAITLIRQPMPAAQAASALPAATACRMQAKAATTATTVRTITVRTAPAVHALLRAAAMDTSGTRMA